MHPLSLIWNIKWCGDLQTHTTANDFLKSFYLVNLICYLDFLVTDIKYFSGRSDNTVEEKLLPEKWMYSLTFVFITSVDWWMRFLSIFLVWFSYCINCNFLPSLFFPAGVAELCITPYEQASSSSGSKLGQVCFAVLSPTVQKSLQFR